AADVREAEKPGDRRKAQLVSVMKRENFSFRFVERFVEQLVHQFARALALVLSGGIVSGQLGERLPSLLERAKRSRFQRVQALVAGDRVEPSRELRLALE